MTTQYSTVKWFDAKKGYGFINHPDGGDDVFIHYSQIESEDDFKTLRTGQSVQFEMNDGPKGLHAVNVQALDDGESDSADDSVDGSDERSHTQAATADSGHVDRAPASPSTADPAPSEPTPAGATAEYSESDYGESDYGDADYEDLDDDYGMDSEYGDTGYDEGDLV